MSRAVHQVRKSVPLAVSALRSPKPCSLSHRIEGKSTGPSTTGSMNISQNPITEPLIPQASTPMDELWSIKAALDLVCRLEV